MHVGADSMRRFVIGIAVVCFAVGLATSAFAVPPNEVLRMEFNQTFTGKCCFSWGETVNVTEPKAVVPITVTFSTDYRSDFDFNSVGISVNAHPCMTTQTLFRFNPTDGTFQSGNFEWVVLPSDGLVRGNNTITLCGGSVTNGSITLGFNTLAARILK